MRGSLRPATASIASAKATTDRTVRARERRVILPKHLLNAATSGGAADYEHLLRDNYETPLYTPQIGGGEVELQQLDMILRLSVNDFMAHARTVSSPDELSVYIAKRLMQQEAPSLLWITMHDIDVAHYRRVFALH